MTSTPTGLLRIGTRGSPLALVQAETVRDRVAAARGRDAGAIEIVPVRTAGDRISGPLSEFGGKGLFTKEIDEALLSGRIDIGVHSAKDLPTKLPGGIAIAACLERGDVRDAFISPVAPGIAELPSGAILGTSSLRRAAMARRVRPDLRVIEFRGNVETRLRKLADGVAQATLLAAAGLVRLGLGDRVTALLDADTWLPAPGQGVIAIAARAGDEATIAMLAAIDHRDSALALAAERAFLAVLDGSCRTPIGALATIDGEALRFRGIIVKPDGSAAHEVMRDGPASEAARMGMDAGRDLASRGGPDFFAT